MLTDVQKESLRQFFGEEVPTVQRINVNPGDRLVLFIDGHLARQQLENLRAAMADLFRDVPVIVLESGMKLAVVGAEVSHV